MSTMACRRSTSVFVIACSSLPSSFFSHGNRSPISIAEHSAMFLPAILLASAAWLSRAPLHSVARTHRQVRLDLLLRALGQCLEIALDVRARELRDDALVARVERLAIVGRLELALAAVEQQVHLGLGELRQLLVRVEEPARRVDVVLPRSEHRNLHGALGQRLRQVEEAIRLDAELLAEAAALGTHALRVVEREHVRVARRAACRRARTTGAAPCRCR